MALRWRAKAVEHANAGGLRREPELTGRALQVDQEQAALTAHKLPAPPLSHLAVPLPGPSGMLETRQGPVISLRERGAGGRPWSARLG